MTIRSTGLRDGASRLIRNAPVFAAMRPDAALINVAQGEKVHEDALVDAVTAGRIRSAVLESMSASWPTDRRGRNSPDSPDPADTAHLGQR